MTCTLCVHIFTTIVLYFYFFFKKEQFSLASLKDDVPFQTILRRRLRCSVSGATDRVGFLYRRRPEYRKQRRPRRFQRNLQMFLR